MPKISLLAEIMLPFTIGMVTVEHKYFIQYIPYMPTFIHNWFAT